MKNLDTISKRILVISISIAIVALSISALFFSVGHAFASNETTKVNEVSEISQNTESDYRFKAIASGNAIVIYNANDGVVRSWIAVGTDGSVKKSF